MDMSKLFHVAVHMSSQRHRQFPTSLKELEAKALQTSLQTWWRWTQSPSRSAQINLKKKKIYCIWPSTDKYSINLKINLLYWSCTHALTSLCDCRFDNSLCHLQMPFYLHFLALEFRNQYIVYTSPGTWLKVQFSLLNHSLSRFPVFVVAVGDHINMQTWIFKKVKSVDDCSFGFCKSTTGSSYEWIGS